MLANGVYTANLTPLKTDYSVDFELLVKHCQYLLANGSTGLAVLGTTGEANSFSLAERKEILDRTIEGGIPADKIMVGTGCCSLPESVELTKHAISKGVGGILLLPPFYYKSIQDSGLLAYFDEFIKAVGTDGLRIYLYHFPKMSGVSFSIDIVRQLKDNYPNIIVGMKDSTGDLENTKRYIDAFPNMQIFPGTEALLLDGLKAGGAGCISATCNVFSPYAGEVYEKHVNGGDASELQIKLTEKRMVFQGLPFSGALKSYLARVDQDQRWLTVRPPNEAITDEIVDGLMEKLS